jgi:hypothetical protein
VAIDGGNPLRVAGGFGSWMINIEIAMPAAMTSEGVVAGRHQETTQVEGKWSRGARRATERTEVF